MYGFDLKYSGRHVRPIARRAFAAAAALTILAGCQPTVQVKAPTEPITINLNVKLDADVRVKLEKQAEQDIRTNKDIF